ncbi:hypothetical protein QE152_g18979 [Popillia japonica]|uniref:Uncharacterized protein n=1 Tax=Popillia japonica TaxID=7064 RepID=A0AAW1L3T9_POPJA
MMHGDDVILGRALKLYLRILAEPFPKVEIPFLATTSDVCFGRALKLYLRILAEPFPKVEIPFLATTSDVCFASEEGDLSDWNPNFNSNNSVFGEESGSSSDNSDTEIIQPEG